MMIFGWRRGETSTDNLLPDWYENQQNAKKCNEGDRFQLVIRDQLVSNFTS